MEVRNLLSHCLVLISLVTPLIGLKITSLSAPSVETSPSLVAEASIAFNNSTLSLSLQQKDQSVEEPIVPLSGPHQAGHPP